MRTNAGRSIVMDAQMFQSRLLGAALVAGALAFSVGGCQWAGSGSGSGNSASAKNAQASRAGGTDGAGRSTQPAAVTMDRPKPSSGATGVTRGKVLASQGDSGRALAEFERAIADNPKLTQAYLGAADIYRQRGDYDKAEPYYGKAAELEPRNFDAQYLHGLSLQLLNRLSDSVRAYLRALSIKPADLNANLNLATAYLQLNEPAEALPYAQKAVDLDGKSAAARVNLGAIYSQLQRHEDAIVEFEQASELTTLSAPLLLNLADSYGKAGRTEQMVNTLQQLIKTEPTANAYERLGSGQFRLRRYEDALAGFRKALEIDPNHYPALNGVGVSLLNQWVWSNQTDESARQEAMRSLRRSLTIERNQPWIVDLVAKYQ
jgi:tetratricopeptide (TPR) repeat protein